MRILLVVPWDQEFGGVASVVGNLAKHFTRQGDEVFFFNPSDSNSICEKKTKWGFRGFGMRLRAPFITAHASKSILSFILFLPSTVARLSRILSAHNIDIVNIHYPSDPYIYFAICCFLLRRKLVISVHGADFCSPGKPGKVPLPTRLLLRLSDAVVAPSQAFLEDVLKHASHVRQKASVIHNGVDLNDFSLQTDDPAVKPHPEYILCIAHHNEKKAIDVLINAFGLVRSKFASLQLILVGDGPVRPLLEALTERLHLSEYVQFVGWKGRDEVAKLLHGCRALVLPSRSEPFGIVVTEAMACKKVVVATRVGGIPEILDNGKNGLLVPPDDPNELANALTWVLTNSEAAIRIGDQGYNTVCARFTYKHMGESYKGLFQRLLGNVQHSDSIRSVAAF